MKLTELGLNNLLESLDTDKVAIEDIKYYCLTDTVCSAHIYIRDEELYYSIDLLYDYCYRVTEQPEEAAYAEHISLIDLLKELRPYMKKAE